MCQAARKSKLRARCYFENTNINPDHLMLYFHIFVYIVSTFTMVNIRPFLPIISVWGDGVQYSFITENWFIKIVRTNIDCINKHNVLIFSNTNTQNQSLIFSYNYLLKLMLKLSLCEYLILVTIGLLIYHLTLHIC